MKKQDRDSEIVKLWLERYPASEDRTRNNVLSFSCWLQQNRSELVPYGRSGGDPYQLVQSILTPYVCSEQ